MAETKPFASLSSGLLARKGTAKPAMRPQGFGSFGSSLEDLGWNDMGHAPGTLHDINDAHELHELPEHVPSSIEALTPAPGGRVHAEPPAVVEQQRELEARLAPTGAEPQPERVEPEAQPEAQNEPEPTPAPARRVQPPAKVVALPRSRAVAPRAKAAFTLRLDPDRHLKLRLACALSRRSAQLLVTEALDNFLDSLPELDALAGQVPGQANQR
ncbi:MAG TPA: hypothetical protein VF759_01440 [Allosphingosinicella sp.]|jgi:hypothetical protein